MLDLITSLGCLLFVNTVYKYLQYTVVLTRTYIQIVLLHSLMRYKVLVLSSIVYVVHVIVFSEEECLRAYQLFNGRWYAQKQLSCEHTTSR